MDDQCGKPQNDLILPAWDKLRMAIIHLLTHAHTHTHIYIYTYIYIYIYIYTYVWKTHKQHYPVVIPSLETERNSNNPSQANESFPFGPIVRRASVGSTLMRRCSTRMPPMVASAFLAFMKREPWPAARPLMKPSRKKM